ncbi:hypothetical protein C8J56DRAFT_892449 [Mycena floridula]|nr:hypothetical protein C8J56DRAFT_892449 [Mycena floridula]
MPGPSNSPRKARKPTHRKPRNTWFNLTPEQASGSGATLSAHGTWSGLGTQAERPENRKLDTSYTNAVVAMTTKKAGSKQRYNPVPFTGCLAHAEITYEAMSQKILRIRGHLGHNAASLEQLQIGGCLTDIQETNRQMTLRTNIGGFCSADTRSLYCQYNRLRGIKTAEPAHVNIHEWLDPDSTEYNTTLTDAIFHYSARETKDDRFEACISTPEMKEAAWKYAHQSQIILDGTFGVCNKNILLFIVSLSWGLMKISVAYLPHFFSSQPPPRTSILLQAAAGCNTDILAKLIGSWRKSLSEHDGVKFAPLVAITDKDLMERGALRPSLLAAQIRTRRVQSEIRKRDALVIQEILEGTQDRKNAWKRGEREQNMAWAMSDVQAGRSSIRQAAQGHQVTPLLLGYRLNGRKEFHGVQEAQRALSGAEEELVTLAGGAGQLGCPFTINLRPRLVIGDCNKDNSHISRKCVIHEPQDDDTRPRNNLNVQSSPQTV